MAITSLRPIKAKNNKKVVRGHENDAATVGYTDQEARGIFGKHHEYTEEEQARIHKYLARKHGDELAYYKQVYADVPTRMRERQRKAEARLRGLSDSRQ